VQAWRDARAWAHAHPRLAAALALLALVEVAYAAYRAAFLTACDLVHGYLEPTRGMLFAGKDPYVEYRFNSFSPFFYALLSPLAPLPNAAASVLWSLLSLGFLFAALAFTRAALPAPSRSPLWAVGAGAVLVVDNLNLGQSNLLALCFTMGAIYALRRGRDLASGLLLAVAIAWKVVPALLLGIFILRGRARALAGAALGLALCLFAVPSLVFGPSRTLGFVEEWSGLVLAPFARGERGLTTNIDWYHTNQSLEAALQRSLTPYGREHYDLLHRYTDPAFLDEAQVHRLSSALRLGVLAALALIAWRTRRDERLLVANAALFLLGALFISPASWFSHYVSALVAYTVALELPSTRARRALALAVVLTFASLGSYVRSHSLVLLGHLVLFAVLWGESWRAAAQRDAGPGRVGRTSP
jgi:hypothetical protein